MHASGIRGFLACLFLFVAVVYATGTGVTSLPGVDISDLRMFSGHIEIDAMHNSKIYYLFVESENDPLDSPLVIWFQGGPGCSSTVFGAFVETGPVVFDRSGQILRNPLSWHTAANVLYVDFPVGVGFSFTSLPRYWPSSLSEAAAQFVTFLTEWYIAFPAHANHTVHLVGESFGAQYVAHVAAALRAPQPAGRLPVRVGSLTTVSGWLDSYEQYRSYADVAFAVGLISSAQYNNLRNQFDTACAPVIRRGAALAATEAPSAELWASFTRECEDRIFHAIVNGSGVQGSRINPYDLRMFGEWSGDRYPESTKAAVAYLNRPDVRVALHVESVVGNISACGPVSTGLEREYLRSPMPLLAQSLASTPLYVLSAQFDLVCPAPATSTLLSQLQWSGAQDWSQTARYLWLEDGQVAGYAQTARTLTHITVLNAGHEIPFAQPRASLRFLQRVLRGASFADLVQPQPPAAASPPATLPLGAWIGLVVAAAVVGAGVALLVTWLCGALQVRKHDYMQLSQ